MDQNPYHVPVMAKEVVEMLRPVSPRLIVDATYGGGGHTRALLQAFPGLQVVAIDQDPDAIAQGPAGDAVRLVKANFASLDQIAAEICKEETTDGSSVPPCIARLARSLPRACEKAMISSEASSTGFPERSDKTQVKSRTL